MPRKILVVDDDVDFLALMSAKLAKAGFTVLTAQDGDEALEITRREGPDMVVLDYFLGAMTGDQICKSIKGDSRLKKIPVILLSGSVASLSPEEFAAIPCEEKITKPFEMSMLLEMISRLLGPAPGAGPS